jgi:hypothetical protein
MKWQELFYNDVEAYARNPEFSWVYDKLNLIKDQGIACAPVGVNPTNYPVCIKPIINLFGLSRDAHYIENIDEYEDYLTDERPSGQFWMPFINGNQYTIDLIFSKGKIIFMDVFQCIPSGRIFGLSEYHVHINDYALPRTVIEFLERKMRKYTGPMNIEVINDVVIEGHLRWNNDDYIWRRRTEFIKMLPLWLDKRKSIPFVTEDVAYVPCFVDREADIEACQDTLNQYGDNRFKVYLDEFDGDHHQGYVCLGTFVVRQHDLREINLIKVKNNWI